MIGSGVILSINFISQLVEQRGVRFLEEKTNYSLFQKMLILKTFGHAEHDKHDL